MSHSGVTSSADAADAALFIEPMEEAHFPAAVGTLCVNLNAAVGRDCKSLLTPYPKIFEITKTETLCVHEGFARVKFYLRRAVGNLYFMTPFKD